MIEYLIEILKSQRVGIIVGVFITILGSIIVKFIFSLPTILRHIRNFFITIKIENDIHKRIQLVNEEMSLQVIPDIKLKISDIRKKPEELENQLLIYINRDNKPQAIANIVSIALDHGFLKDAKRHVGENIFQSVKYTLGKSILTRDYPIEKLRDLDKEALRHFERIMDEILIKSDIKDLVIKEELMLKKKLFKTVLLQELFALGERNIGNITKNSEEESLEFVNFLYNIARKDEYLKETGNEPPLSFIKSHYKVGIVLVKRPEKENLYPHYKAIKSKIKNGALSIYILGWGKNVTPVKADLVKWLKSSTHKNTYPEWQVRKIIEYRVSHQFKEDVPGICVIYTHNQWIPGT